ncbi:alpha/beta hydrolase [Bacillus sp. FJAT-18017]|uniref:alpha/beta fold hydrolase n=1 Tax=Bacillus sp. FJAT-18017 TaxID=1705566 RepID=UPI0006AFCF39|nr:alpha/beta fold hydrolase [Bacillus sp. FJAT-18017]ALC89059.1 alpha/beta hydrolase [Bacillus sp. FJAT-18017]
MPVMSVNGNELFYEVFGPDDARETVVFLNGVMTTTSSWALYYPLFVKLGYRVVLHDFKGQMKSAKPPGPYSFREHAEEAAALLDELGVNGPVHLIGTSYGGEVALRFAIDYPDRAASLVVIDSTSELDETTKLFVEGWKQLALGPKGEAFFWGAAPSLYYNAFVERNKEFLAERARMMNDIDDEYFAGQVTLYETFLRDADFTNELGKVVCPTLVVVGENDILKPRWSSDILAKGIAGAEYLVIPECGHVAIFEKPDALKSALLGFVVKNSELGKE